jgi:SWI/SNF-related matrix-associated actin-dependent regulator 1 of chromatin subfamily A
MRIPAEFRVLLTGTPLQNNLRELASLLGFILPKVFAEKQEDLEFIFKHKAKTKDDTHDALLSNQRISRAKQMMMPFILRRKKQQVLKHLPSKVCRVESCNMSSTQNQWYQTQATKLRALIEARAAGDQSKSDVGNPMMILRKAAIHPILFRRQFTDETLAKMAKACLKEPEYRESLEELVYEDMQVMTDLELYRFCENHADTMSPFQLEGEPWMDSGKVQRLAELLKTYKDNGDRCLVFSQFTIVLDILDSVLETLDISYFRLDGQTKIDERQDMIDEFYTDPSITVFLLSTKAGGSGINLACANKVIIFDSSFNPQEDVQAENRAHRVGQTRDVEVVRLVSKGTIEEAIAKLGESKLVLDDRVAGDDKEGEKLEKIGEDLVAKMFLGGDDREERKPEGEATVDETNESAE